MPYMGITKWANNSYHNSILLNLVNIIFHLVFQHCDSQILENSILEKVICHRILMSVKMASKTVIRPICRSYLENLWQTVHNESHIKNKKCLSTHTTGFCSNWWVISDTRQGSSRVPSTRVTSPERVYAHPRQENHLLTLIWYNGGRSSWDQLDRWSFGQIACQGFT